MSNVFCEAYLTLISVIFLAQSPDLTEMVLNAFALNFIVRVDDIINVFDSDEEVMIMQDLRAFDKSNCITPRDIRFRAYDYLAVLLVPMRIFEILYVLVEQLYLLLLTKKYCQVDESVFKWDEEDDDEDDSD